MIVQERIPALSEKELERLHAGEVRLAQFGTDKQKIDAEGLLPSIGAAVAQRRSERETLLADKKASLKQTRLAAGPKPKPAKAAKKG